MAVRNGVAWLGVCLGFFPFLAGAQTPGDQNLIRDRQERLLQQQQQRLQELQQLPGREAQAPAEPAPGDQRCFAIEQIEISGASLLSEADRAAILAPFADSCLGVSQLNALLKAITNHYIDRGYVTTRAYLPQQDLSARTLKIRSSASDLG